MVELILGQFLPYIIAGLAAVAGIFGFGYQQRRKGKAEAQKQQRLKDLETAAETRKKLNALDDDNDVSPVERLRNAGRLRDGD